jgi:hypothetical protein
MTPDEERRLLKMLEAHERAAWFWSSLGIWAKWLASIAAAVAGIKYLGDLLKGSFK